MRDARLHTAHEPELIDCLGGATRAPVESLTCVACEAECDPEGMCLCRFPICWPCHDKGRDHA